MNQTEIGKFISKCRKEKGLTQAQLAEKLNITDRAVSKWETGKSMPDSSIMLQLCEILGISANELLSGEKSKIKQHEKKNDLTTTAKHKLEIKRKKGLIPLLYSSTLFIAILVCLICNLAIDGIISWSLIPTSAIIFTWVITFPAIYLKKRGIIISFISLSIFIIPFLFLISRVTKTKEVFTIGTATAVTSIVFLWVVISIFHFIGKTRISTAAGISFLLSIPYMFTINIILSNMIAEPILDIWDILSAFLLLTAAVISFLLGKKK